MDAILIGVKCFSYILVIRGGFGMAHEIQTTFFHPEFKGTYVPSRLLINSALLGIGIGLSIWTIF